MGILNSDDAIAMASWFKGRSMELLRPSRRSKGCIYGLEGTGLQPGSWMKLGIFGSSCRIPEEPGH